MDTGAMLYDRFRAGDTAAFEELVVSFRPGLIAFIRRFVGDEDTAEDIAVEVFTDLLTARRRYDGRSSLKTYLYMLGRSRALDRLRHDRVLPTAEWNEDLISPDPTPEQTAETRERRERIRAAVAALPEAQRTALLLVYEEEMSYEQTARVMHKSRKQIDNLLYRAKTALREALGEEILTE